MAVIQSPVANREKRLLLVVSLVMSIFAVGLFLEEVVYQYNQYAFDQQMRAKGISFSNDDWGRKSPAGLLLLVPLITLSLIKPKRFWISSSLTFLLGILFVIGCYFRVMNAIDFGMLNPIANTFDFWDYLFGTFLIVMFIWHTSILIRLAKAPLEKLP